MEQKDPLDVERHLSCGHSYTMRWTACPTCFAELKEEVQRLSTALAATERRCGEMQHELDLAARRAIDMRSEAARDGAEIVKLRQLLGEKP